METGAASLLKQVFIKIQKFFCRNRGYFGETKSRRGCFSKNQKAIKGKLFLFHNFTLGLCHFSSTLHIQMYSSYKIVRQEREGVKISILEFTVP